MAMKIGVLIDSYQLPFEEALEKASQLRVDGIQMFTTKGRLAAWELDESARKSLRTVIESKGLEVSALCGDLGGHGFELAKDNKEKIRKTEAIVELAVDLGASAVTTHIGVVPPEKNDTYRTLLLALREISSYAGMRGIKVAIETGPEPALRLRSFLDDVGEEALGVNFDPANLVMVQGTDPVEDFKLLREFIVSTHAKDGRMVKKGDPVAIYGAFAEGAPDDFHVDDYFLELPLGEGAVNFPRYIAALKAMNYEGYLTIEREAGNDRVGDIARGVNLLRELLGR
ncbi:MAG TPA: sugar phosphate isomerase/epimerase [Spirochaetia bacterium]|nr:sugar phosphate isomerase/epimerase [Spirochaetia bacterium]